MLVPTPEDVIITKLRWSLLANRSKDRDDARDVIAVQGDRIDWDYVHPGATATAPATCSTRSAAPSLRSDPPRDLDGPETFFPPSTHKGVACVVESEDIIDGNEERRGCVASIMRVILDVLQGPRQGRSFVFDRHDTFIVGRSRFVHCPMPEDSALSRDHFLIEINPPRCEVRDLGSTNGTFVNDRRVERVRLSSGDRIAAGQSVFQVRVEGASWSGDSGPDAGRRGAGRDGDARPERPADRLLGLRGGGAARRRRGRRAGVPRCPASRSTGSARRAGNEAAAVPQPVPHFTTLRELGRGAMGVVYQARHNQTGRLVALKLIVPESAAARSAVDRFLREMSVISQLKHPNIVEWLEQGMTRGQFWFAMEYVQGTNLESIANETPGRYPVDQACRMICQVLKGLEQAHSLGFVHRDIKPENILIGRGPDGLVAKISDFGLAKSFRGLGLSGLTFSGEMRGTVPFMPPEQMLDFKTVTPAGDLYSTAATLYYLLSCQFIYDQVGEGGDLIRMLLEEPPVPILSRRADVPARLAAVLEKCLARDPKDRYPTAAAMRKALRPFC